MCCISRSMGYSFVAVFYSCSYIVCCECVTWCKRCSVLFAVCRRHWPFVWVAMNHCLFSSSLEVDFQGGVLYCLYVGQGHGHKELSQIKDTFFCFQSRLFGWFATSPGSEPTVHSDQKNTAFFLLTIYQDLSQLHTFYDVKSRQKCNQSKQL